MKLTSPARLALLVVALSLTCWLLLLAPAGSATNRTATTIGLPDCLGKPRLKPASVVLACADGNFSVSKLAWTGWGQTFAAGRGTGSLNDCKPNCAAGHFHSYPVILLTTGRQNCHGNPAYTSITYAFITQAPYPVKTVKDATIGFPCR
jgi:hypothetical protein